MKDEHDNPDSIESLFQRKAEDYHIPFREEDWNRLEKRLDLYDMQRSYRRKFQLAVAALILILSSVGYYTYDNNLRLNQLTDQIQSEIGSDIPAEDPSVSQVPGSNDLYTTDSAQQPETVQIRPESLGMNVISDESIPALIEEPAQIFHQSSDLLANLNHTPVSGSTFQNQIPEELIWNMIRMPETRVERADYFTHTNGIHTESSDHHDQYSEFITHRQPDSGFTFGFNYSPDFSRPDFTTAQSNAGFRTGVKGEYQISKRISLTTGLLLSRVRYTASGRQYNPPDYWNQGILPEETNAICLILDIPVGIKYNVSLFENSRIFSIAALSSYIMLNEDYYFDYAADYQGLANQINIKNGSRHLLNHLNLSIGYEYDLTPALSVRTEPFIQLPLSGVGWGDVRFYSMGGYVSLNLHM